MGSRAVESKSLLLCSRISVLSPADGSVIGNELLLAQRFVGLSADKLWQQQSHWGPGNAHPHPEAGGGIVVTSPGNSGRRLGWIRAELGSRLGGFLTERPWLGHSRSCQL